MTQPGFVTPCPRCGAPMPQGASLCPACAGATPMPAPHPLPSHGQSSSTQPYVAPQFQRQSGGSDGTEFLIPTNVSAWSIAACYIGLVGCGLPFIGLPFALVGLFCGIMALARGRKKRSQGTYGAVTSDIRAILGIIFSLLGLGWWVVMLVANIARVMHG
ncbi:MAG: hypothetical protein HYS13_21825 [Planctomycetia bacterium]|nr:hypothetical protein [Planctomycetia bacterium]